MPDLIDVSHWPILVIAALAVFTGSILQGSTGLGLGMVAAPILLMIDPVFVPGPLLVMALVLSLLMARREWRSIDRQGLVIALSGRVPGSILAGLTISMIPNSVYGLVFGILVVAAVLLSIGGYIVAQSRRNLLIAGFASGYMGTLTSIGAPPIALAYQRGEASQVRSTMAAFFVIGTVLSIAILVFYQRFSVEQIFVSLLLLPPLLAGFLASSYALQFIDKRRARWAILGFSGISGAALIAKSLMSGW